MPLKPREIWEKGAPLNDAWRQYSDSKFREEYEKATGSRDFSPLNFDEGFFEKLNAVVGYLAPMLPVNREMIIQQMRSHLTESLRQERLIAFGYPVWPSEGRTPRKVHAHFWVNSEIDWDRETARDNSYEFQKIRVINPTEFPTLNLKPDIGRKTYRDLIYHIISECVAENHKFSTELNKIKIEKIRSLIKTKYPDIDPYGPGLGTDAIRKHLRAYFSKSN